MIEVLPSIKGERSPESLADAGEAALKAEDFHEAIALFDAAEKGVADPDRCAGGRWLAHMLRGTFRDAWHESDAIRRRGAPDPHRFWLGEELRGQRVMLRSLHGFGDAVQMFRFLPRLRAVASHLVVEVPPRMLELAPCFAGMGQAITWGELAPPAPPAWDVQVEVMELPYLLRVGADDLRPCERYLRIPEAERDLVRAAMGKRLRPRVGVVWAAGHWNPSRSIPFELLHGLLGIDGAEFWNLQGGNDRRQWAGVASPERRDAHELGEGILRLAAVIEQMDLVITVDTLAAHLAGALGVPCWILLQRGADWRWMCGRDDTPWYPSLRLLRQPVPDDWETVLARTERALRAWIGHRRGGLNC